MSSKIQYNSIGNSVDGTRYCAGVETFAQNLIEENEEDATIVYPSADGWITPRSESYRLTTDNAMVILQNNIYKIISIVVPAEYIDVMAYDEYGISIGYWVNFSKVKNSNNQPVTYIDATSQIFEKNVYDTLKISFMDDVSQNTKNNTIFYTQGTNFINLGGEIRNIFGVSKYNVQQMMLKIIEDLNNNHQKYNGYYYYEEELEGIKRYINEYTAFSLSDKFPDDPRQLQFRVTYIPISSDTKLRARKSAKTNVDYIQPINQRAEINSVSALGKFLHNTAQKTGTSQITLVRWYKHLADIPPVGAWVKHKGERYILTANSYEMTNCIQLKVTHTLSKNWSNKSQYVSVDQKYRNYNIPADMLWRNLYWEDFVEVTTDGVIESEAGALDKHEIANIFKIDASEDKTVTSFFMYKLGIDLAEKDGVTAPCSTLGMANSIVFMASMKDNRSAGLRINPDNDQYCEEVFYCNDDGTLNSASIILSDGVSNMDSKEYPFSDVSSTLANSINGYNNILFRKFFYIDKDPGEALKFTYQVHFLSDNPDVIIGGKLAENHPLVKKWTGNRKFKFWKLNKKLRPGDDKVSTSDGVSSSISSENTRVQYWVLADSTITGVQAFKIQLMTKALSKLSNKKAWAITDDDNNLYVGCNDVSKTTLYFSHIHKRK